MLDCYMMDMSCSPGTPFHNYIYARCLLHLCKPISIQPAVVFLEKEGKKENIIQANH